MSYPQAWNRFRRHRRLPGIPCVLVPAILSDSNDNKTIHYTADHEIICRGCIDRDNNVPQDVLIAPESNGIEWSCALGIHLFRYAHLTPLRVPPCRAGRDRIQHRRMNFRCDICTYRTRSLQRFVLHIMLSPTNHTVGIPPEVNILTGEVQDQARAGNAFGDADDSDESIEYDPDH